MMCTVLFFVLLFPVGVCALIYGLRWLEDKTNEKSEPKYDEEGRVLAFRSELTEASQALFWKMSDALEDEAFFRATTELSPRQILQPKKATKKTVKKTKKSKKGK